MVINRIHQRYRLGMFFDYMTIMTIFVDFIYLFLFVN